ncbi:MAG: DnaD domain protein [Oscillospiraceae bacterium]|nr:DnaD domain protein [Oscillospiraceae bacterium]
MKVSIKQGKWKRYFSVPCALTDEYLKLADAASLKVLLYLLASESDENVAEKVISSTGITKTEFDGAVAFWKQYDIIDSDNEIEINTAVSTADKAKNEQIVAKIVHSHYTPGDIAKMLSDDVNMRRLFDEAEITLGRILKHADRETLICLKDYYGFKPMSIIAILSYCASLDKTSARYIEGVAKGLFDKGITDFSDIEDEFSRLNEVHSFENKVKSAFGLETKLTPKQKSFIESWKALGFDIDMISLASERCIDSTNKIYFPYINKILSSWAENNIFTREEAEKESKPIQNQKIEKTSSFDLDEFDALTLGIDNNK